MEQTYTFHVHGMHCNSCVLLTESELGDVAGVARVSASLARHTVDVTGDFGDVSQEEILAMISPVMAKHGYTLSLEQKQHEPQWHDFRTAFPIAALFVMLFIMLQKLGVVDLVGSDTEGYTTAFVVGVVASVSSCMAVVGGLVLSVSASFAKEGSRVRPQIFFHVGRLAAFFLLGGAIGALGSVFRLGVTGTLAVGVLLGIVMLILGVNLLDVFPWAKKFQPTMPRFVTKHLLGIKKVNHTLTPLLVGVITFFLPCGFTQSMQVYALTTGTFLTGALTMFVFALGTLPALALLSFASLGIKNSAKSGVFFKAAGLIVIFFALFNIVNVLVAAGVLPPLYNL